MNLIEGSKRMRSAGRIVLLASLSFVTLTILLTVIPALVPQYIQIGGYFHLLFAFPGLFLNLCVIALILGAVLWIAGWIVEGFAQPAS
jgi:hypothetical protein